MPIGTFDVDTDEIATASEAPSGVEIPDRIWMRTCAQCGLVLWKSSRDEDLQCVCGWEWLS